MTHAIKPSHASNKSGTPRPLWKGRMRVLARTAVTSIALLTAVVGHAETASGELRVFGAGSLKAALSAVMADYTQSAPQVKIAAQWGPAGALREKLETGTAFDLYASAALGHAVTLERKGISGPAVVFARNTLCAVTPSGFALNTDNFAKKLLEPETRIATSTPKADPGGDYTWQMFERIDAVQPGAFKTLSTKAQQLYGSGVGTAPARLTDFLDSGRADLLMVYCTSARAMTAGSPAYRVVTLPAELQVGADYALTVARKAHPQASNLALYILSPAGQQRLAEFGFQPVTLPAGNAAAASASSSRPQ